jgi:hypothetical protein
MGYWIPPGWKKPVFDSIKQTIDLHKRVQEFFAIAIYFDCG